MDETVAWENTDVPSLADLSPLEGAHDAIGAALRKSGRVCVIGAPGSGHATLANQLQALLTAHPVRLPPVGPDSALHALVQVAACLEDESTRRLATDDSSSVRERAGLLARHVAASGTRLIVTLPASWTKTEATAAPDEADYLDRNGEFLDGLLSEASLQVILLSERLSPRLGSAFDVAPIRLQVLPILWDTLTREDVWGPLTDYAATVQRFSETDLSLSPIAVRVAVGFLALGGRLQELNRCLFGHGGDLVPALAGEVVHLLESSRVSEALRDAVLLLATSRFPLPADKVAGLVGDLEQKEKLVLRQCLAYGDEEVRMPEAVRVAVSRKLRRAGPDARWKLAEVHRSMDGVPSPSQATGTGALHWMERSHHLGHAGTEHESEWQTLVDAVEWPRELIWDHARSLSRDYQEFGKAAHLFRQPDSETRRTPMPGTTRRGTPTGTTVASIFPAPMRPGTKSTRGIGEPWN